MSSNPPGGGDTTLPTVAEPIRDVVDDGPRIDFPEGRYRTGALLGKGGMGEIWEWHDQAISRTVAGKVLRREHSLSQRLRVRFLREARIQGQLEHPSVVPVYELGTTPAGDAYFTMKRVHGQTLGSVLTRLRQGDPAVTGKFSRRKLLTALSTICQVVDLAHRKGIVHRDIKPENIMFGDFGEVYLLDWGIAKTLNAEDEGSTTGESDPSVTVDGTTPGTPHYMAPEQRAKGMVGPRTDVFGLGAVLFECLALAPLHEQLDDEDPFASLPEATRVAIPPELAMTCRRALAPDPAKRYATASELHLALERYLDGDRDLELRQRLSVQHTEEGRRAAERAFAEVGDHEAARKRAASEIGRALALDPDNPQALATLLRLLTEPPREMPPGPIAAAEAEEVEFARRAAWMGGFGHLAVLATIVLCALVLGLREPASFAAACALAAVTAGLGFARGSARLNPLGVPMAMTIASALAVAIILARATSPVVIFPLLILVNASIFVMHVGPRGRLLLMLGCAVAIALPIVLEGIAPLTVWRGAKQWILRPRMLDDLSLAWTGVIHVLVVFFSCHILGRYRDHMRAADLRLQFQAWQLRQVVGDTRVR